MSNITEEIKKRRTFAIISHPDAGKTTLTEKFLLYGGAINLAIGIFGLRGANDPRKIGAFYALAIIGLAFAVLSALGTFFGGSADGGDIASALFGLVLPLVCVLLAYNIKKENNL